MNLYYGKAIVELVKQINSKLDKNMRDHFCDCNLTIPQMSVLMLLNQYGEMKITDISLQMGLTNGTTSGIIDRLERTGLVKRIRLNEDRRVVKVSLTEKACSSENDYGTKLEDLLDNLFSKVPQEKLITIVKSLQLLNTLLEDEKNNVQRGFHYGI